MKNLIILSLIVISSCGARVRGDGNMWICTFEAFPTTHTFRFNTLKEANDKCTELIYGITPGKKKVIEQIGKEP